MGNALTEAQTNTVDKPGSPSTSSTESSAPEDTETSGTDEDGTSTEDTPTAETGGGGSSEVVIPAAEEGLKFATDQATASAGQLTLKMANPSDIPHNIAVDKPQKKSGPVVGKCEVSTITVNFPAGRYEYYCAVPGHREAGMRGTLVVE